MNRPIEILSEELPQCECCGRPIFRPGLCGLCAECFEEVSEPKEVSLRIPDGAMLHPADLMD